MWSDNETSLDLLGYRHLVGAVVDVVQTDRLLPATLGVFGDWGSGKSSLIQMVRAELEADPDTLVLVFNGWLFEGYEDAKTALMGTILDELADQKKLTVRGKDLVLRLLRRINLMRVAGSLSRVAMGYAAAGLPGVALGSVPDLAHAGASLLEKAKDVDPSKLGEFLRNEDTGQQVRRSVREFRDDFADLLKETKLKRLVVIVDDLDRCTPDTIIETLEAIKLFLFVPNTAFIIGADERLVRYAVRRRFPELPGERVEVGRDYLEKLVQFPVRIPPMGRAETEAYIKLLLVERCGLTSEVYERVRSAGVVTDCGLDVSFGRKTVADALGESLPANVDDAIALAERIAPVLAAGLLGNPRQCKRFLNTLVMRRRMAESRKVELKPRALAKLMLLEYLRPEAFKELARLQTVQIGKPVELAQAERKRREDTAAQSDEPPHAWDTRESTPPKARASGGKGSIPRPVTPPPESERPPSAPLGLVGWDSDSWLADWLTSDPPLADEDLRPYFYFAREKLDPLAGLALRMSPEAQETLAKLLGAIDAERTLALNRAAAMSPVDAAAILEALGTRARQIENPSAVDSPLARMCDWIEKRPELFGEFTTFLKSLPHSTVPFAITPRLVQLGSTAPDRKRQLLPIFEAWKNGSNMQLKTVAATQLAKLSK